MNEWLRKARAGRFGRSWECNLIRIDLTPHIPSIPTGSAVQLLLFKLTGKEVYKKGFNAFMDSFMATKRTPKGLVYFDQVRYITSVDRAGLSTALDFLAL